MKTAGSEAVDRFFSGFADKWDSLYGKRRGVLMRMFDNQFRRDVYERYELTFTHLPQDLTGSSVLDVGCGSGIYCFEAARRGADKVVGIDGASGMIEIAREKSKALGYAQRCEFVTSTLPADSDIPALRTAYDYAIVMGVTDYVSDLPAFLSALRAVVRGSAVLSFPGKHWLRGPLRQYRYKALGRCDVFTYDPAVIVETCRRAGFSRTDVRTLNHSGICYIVTTYA